MVISGIQSGYGVSAAFPVDKAKTAKQVGGAAKTASFRLYGPPSADLVELALARLLEIRLIRVRSAVSAEELTVMAEKKSISSLL